ncbi:uncharacterized protein LOC102080441 [Oreochromis niloticus]|uniref:uncharacterized protein LOC102080441 n=1 Tax=Oreochromis niloticus TaxID=8128 RepID=UPI000DF455AE|nr:uncharacterized protein LOC102080441 [Oreochromis niloticus]
MWKKVLRSDETKGTLVKDDGKMDGAKYMAILEENLLEVQHAQDPLQFAYKADVRVEDAILSLLHRAHSHLDKGKGTEKLNRVQVDPCRVAWISNYLTDRPQYVRLKDNTSDILWSAAQEHHRAVPSPLCNGNHSLSDLCNDESRCVGREGANNELCHSRRKRERENQNKNMFPNTESAGETADGWTVKRTRGGLTDVCGAAPGFGGLLGSYCVVDLSAPNETFWCEDSSGQQSDRVSFIVQSETTDKGVILEIPALPVRTGSDVILHCRQRNGDTVEAYFFIKGSSVGPKSEYIITNITQADEGFYWCSTNQGGTSPQSSLRVRDPHTIIHPPPHCPPPSTSTNFAPPVKTALTCSPCSPPPPPSPPPPSSLLVPVVVGLVSGLLLVLVLGLILFLCWKLKGNKNPSPSPVDVTYADVTIKQRANRRDKHPADPRAVYSDVRTQTSGPEDVAYGQVVIKSKKKGGKRKGNHSNHHNDKAWHSP